MTSVVQSYPLKLPQTPQLRKQVDWLQDLSTPAAQQLLEVLWTEDWLGRLDESQKKAYKVIGERQVRLSINGEPIYLPSRIRRCIAEQVGRILHSQSKRMNCYYDVIKLVQVTGVEGKLDSLVRTVGLTLSQFHGKYYRWALIRQTLRTLRRYYYKLGLDLAVFSQIPYTKLVKPAIRNLVLPYAPDDGQAIKINQQEDQLTIQMKLPTTQYPVKPRDWSWTTFALRIPLKIQQRLPSALSKFHRPTLRYVTLKGRLSFPFLDLAWTIKHEPEIQLNSERTMATDLGLVNLTTSVISEAGSQISSPVFWSPEIALLHKIEQLYYHIAHLQRKLASYPKNWVGQQRRFQERERLYRKLNRYRQGLLHLTSNQLLETAVQWHCQIIVLEDLRTYEPPKNQRKLSRKLSNWLRGSLYGVLQYKAKRFGIKIRRVNPRWTSSYCPRCGQMGLKITDARSMKEDKRGRMFHCPSCSYIADRDYIAALNIYRVFQEHPKKHYSLKHAKPVPYMATDIPLNHPSGETTQSSLSG
ncbi:MAG: RNA-guided endonuclease InsQ/TnpB family protein [Candidatus Heimdallarchaeota archaeon]